MSNRPNSMIDVGGSQILMDPCMNRQKTGSLYHAMPEAGATKNVTDLVLCILFDNISYLNQIS